MDASDPAYMSKDAVGQKRLRSLCDKLEELSDDRCRQLLQALVDSSQQVAGGPQAIKDDLASVKVNIPYVLHHSPPHSALE